MQENWIQLQRVFNQKHSFVLATIVATKGSTYRKAGTVMLIDSSGVCTGLLSGGCLEADISLHALDVLKVNRTKLLKYDLSADADLLWGLGLGCDGEIDILLQPLTPANNHLEFDLLLNCIESEKRSTDYNSLVMGHYTQRVSDDAKPFAQFVPITTRIPEVLSDKKERDNLPMFVIPVAPPISILICGAGPDVIPLVEFANSLGWRVTVWDHREKYLSQPIFATCYSTKLIRAQNTLPEQFNTFEAVISMTHNLENDEAYLSKCLASDVAYIGLLGPRNRRDKLLKNLNVHYEDVRDRVYGPVGLNIGGRSPQAIALSIVAQVQEKLSIKRNSVEFQSFCR